MKMPIYIYIYILNKSPYFTNRIKYRENSDYRPSSTFEFGTLLTDAV